MGRKLWNKDYLLMLQGHAVSTIGDVMYSVAIGYWVYEKTGSTSLMGIMSSISMFVTMFLSPFAGSIIDRCNRKWMVVTIDALQGLVMLVIALLAFLNSLNVPVVILAAVVASFGSVLYSPAVSTMMLDLIPHDEMVRGQSIYSASKALINLVGSAFSGVMVAFFGVPLIVAINGVSNLYSAATELFINVPRSKQQGTPVTVKGVLKDIGTALKIVFTNRYLKLFIPFMLILNLLSAGPFSLILPFCMEKGFSVDMYGYLMAAYMTASVVATLVMGAVKLKPKQRYSLMSSSFVISLLFFFAAYMSNQFILTCVMTACAALFNVAANSIFFATMSLALPEENRGAILGFVDAASTGGSALSALIYGFLGDLFPLYIVFATGVAITIVPMLILCINPRTKEFILTH